jgi:hypothetical protein
MKLWRDKRGSITLEATLVLPFFLVFVIALIVIIRLAIVQMAVQSAVSEGTKQIATHIYPMVIIYDKWQGTPLAQAIEEGMGKADEIQSKVDEYGAIIPPVIINDQEIKFDGSERRLTDWTEEQMNNAAKIVTSPLADKLVKSVADTDVLNIDNLKTQVVDLPDLKSGGSGYIILESQYTMQLPIPILHIDPITIKKKAVERAWIGL